MQALMLAAGVGKRLEENINKCLVKIEGNSLFERVLFALKKGGISKLAVVTGFNAKELEKEILKLAKGFEVQFIRANDYETTNNIWSLYLAKDVLTRDATILLESDLVYESHLITDLINNEKKDVAVVAKLEKWMNGTTVLLNNEKIKGFVLSENFDKANYDVSYKTVNIYKLSRDFSRNIFVPFLKTTIDVFGKKDYYEAVLGAISYLKPQIMHASIYKGKWYEIDTQEDLKTAKQIFAHSDNV